MHIHIVCRFEAIQIACFGERQANTRVAVVTLDFDASACFELGGIYSAQYANTTDPAAPVPMGISLVDSEDIHRGWVKEESRLKVDNLLQAGYTNIVVEVAKLGRRWTKYDHILGAERSYRLGEATVRWG